MEIGIIQTALFQFEVFSGFKTFGLLTYYCCIDVGEEEGMEGMEEGEEDVEGDDQDQSG